VRRFAWAFASPARIAFESRVLIFAAMISWRKRKKIKIFLTHIASKTAPHGDVTLAGTSRNPLKSLAHFCHGPDTTAIQAG
jgi:hypothetical protein